MLVCPGFGPWPAMRFRRLKPALRWNGILNTICGIPLDPLPYECYFNYAKVDRF